MRQSKVLIATNAKPIFALIFFEVKQDKEDGKRETEKEKAIAIHILRLAFSVLRFTFSNYVFRITKRTD